MGLSNLFHVQSNNPTESLLQKGFMADKNHDIQESIRYLEEGLKTETVKTPKRIKKLVMPATVLLASHYMKLNEFNKAGKMYANALNQAKTDMEKMNLHEAAGKACYLAGDFENSASHYLQSLHYASKNTPKEHIKVVHSHLLHQLGHVLLDNHPKITEDQKYQAEEFAKFIQNQPNSYDQTLLTYYRDLGADLWEEYENLS